MEDIINYIKPELLILIAVLYFVGMGIKSSEIKDKFIPLILGVGGVVLALAWVLGTSEIASFQEGILAAFTAITQGILCAGTAVYANQLVKQLGKKE